MDDVNIIICCKLRERVIPGIDWPVSAGLTGAEYLSNCAEETAKRGTKARERAPRYASCDYRFSCAFTREYPRGKVEIMYADRRYALYSSRQISYSRIHCATRDAMSDKCMSFRICPREALLAEKAHRSY